MTAADNVLITTGSCRRRIPAARSEERRRAVSRRLTDRGRLRGEAGLSAVHAAGPERALGLYRAQVRYASCASTPSIRPVYVSCLISYKLLMAQLMKAAFSANMDGRAWRHRDGLGLSATSVEQTRAGFLLDEAACGQELGGALQEACQILPGAMEISPGSDACRCVFDISCGTGCADAEARAGIAGRDLPLTFVTALADRGALATALAVQQARAKPASAAGDDSTQALQEAEAVLHITMHFGLVHEAFCQASRAA